MSRRASVLAAAAGPRAWCSATVRRTASLDAIDAGLRAVCAARPPMPRLASGPLLGTTLEECTGTRAPGAEPATGPADRVVHRAEPTAPRPRPGSAAAAPPRPTGPTGPTRPTRDPARGRPAPPLDPADRLPPGRLRELAGPVRSTRARPAAAAPAAAPRVVGGGGPPGTALRPAPVGEPQAAVRSLPARPGLPALVGQRLARRVGLGERAVARLGASRIAPASPQERAALHAALDDGAAGRGPGVERGGQGGAPEPVVGGRVPTGPGVLPARRRRSSGTPPLPGATPAAGPAAGPEAWPAARVPTAVPDPSPRAPDHAGLPAVVPGPFDRPTPAPVGRSAPLGADEAARPGIGAGVDPAPALAAPELERLLDQVLTDAARRHGIEV